MLAKKYGIPLSMFAKFNILLFFAETKFSMKKVFFYEILGSWSTHYPMIFDMIHNSFLQ